MKPEIAEQIARQEPFFRPVITVPDGVELQRGELNGVEVEWTIPSDGVKDETLTVLYTHGGGYSGGLAAWARRATARLAKKLGCKVVAPDYRWVPTEVLGAFYHL